MTAFHTIAIPHDDILQSRLTMDIFAADLWEVYKGRGAEDYRDSELFFQKTFLTEGLENLLDLVGRRLKGQGGDPVIQVQTPFGGGKTHALIAMYHKAREWEANCVVIVGTPLSAKETLWGRVEEQLTGQQKAFAGLVSPGRDDLRSLLEQHQPLLILMDELLQYATKAAGVRVEESTLAGQMLAFMQELSEAIGTLDRACLVVTLPSSILEHYDESAEKLFQQLQRVSGRVEKIYTPVQEHEISSVVRRRLFSQVDMSKAKKAIKNFMVYAQKEGLLPQGMEPSEYQKRFEAAFPFQPEVVDILYQRWGSFPTFQRTRGVLRLLGLLVHELKDSSLPYMTLGDFALANQEIRHELLKHIGPEFGSVIAADITGPEAGAGKASAELGKAYQGLRLGERAATAIFMHSFSGGPERGANLGEIKRAAATLEAPAAVVSEAVEQLSGHLFFLQSQGGRYFFTNQPNLNLWLLRLMENVRDSEIADIEEELLEGQIQGSPMKVFPPWPDAPSQIPDTPDLKLVILREADEGLMREFIEKKGETPRVHRNTLFFLAPLEGQRLAFDRAARKHLAYQSMEGDKSIKVTDEQRQEIKAKVKNSSSDLDDALRRMYCVIYVPARDGPKSIELGVSTFGERKGLDQEIYERLRSAGEILEKMAPIVIKERFLRESDFASTEQIYRASLTTPGEPRMPSADAWQRSIAEGVGRRVFGLGELENERPKVRHFGDATSPSLAGSEVIISERWCQKVAEQPEETEKPEIVEASDEEEQKATRGRTSIGLRFRIPKGKVSSMMGLLNFLQTQFERMEISLSASEGLISDEDYENKLRETFRQMGVDVEETQ